MNHITPETLIPLSAVAALLWAVWRVSSVFTKLIHSIDELRREVQHLGKELDNFITHDEMTHFIDITRAEGKCDLTWPYSRSR